MDNIRDEINLNDVMDLYSKAMQHGNEMIRSTLIGTIPVLVRRIQKLEEIVAYPVNEISLSHNSGGKNLNNTEPL